MYLYIYIYRFTSSCKSAQNSFQNRALDLKIVGGSHQHETLSNRNKVVLVHTILGFLSRIFTIHRTAEEEGGYFFNSSLPLPPVSLTLRH